MQPTEVPAGEQIRPGWCAVLAHASWVLQSRAEQPPDASQQDEAVVSLPEVLWS
jgi:hypothetical protein